MNPDHDATSTQRLHDLHAVYSNFKTVLDLLRSGYRFDDQDAKPALAQLEKALGVLDRELRERDPSMPRPSRND